MPKKIRADLVSVLILPDQTVLRAGDDVPEGVVIGDHALEPAGDQPDQETSGTEEAPDGNDSREKWVTYARSKGAPESELVAKEDGGLSRDDLRAKYRG